MAPPSSASAPSCRRSRRRRTTTVTASLVVLVGAAAVAALAVAATPASAARILASTSGSGGWGGSGGQLARAVRREEELLQKQFAQRTGGGGQGGGGSSRSQPQPQPQRLGQLPPSDCLYIFDVDRTLTGIQGSGGTGGGDGSCPADKTTSIQDGAYGKGRLTYSDLILNMRTTYGGKNCYLGVISHGDATSNTERDAIAKLLSRDVGGNAKMPNAADLAWSDASAASPKAAPFLHSAPKATAKFEYVPLIVKYYQQNAGVAIKASNVYFFDDIAANVAPWKSSNYNAAQISCASRDKGDLGKCGATAAELAKHRTGCNLCTGAC